MINEYLSHLQEGAVTCSLRCAKILGLKAFKTYDSPSVGVTTGANVAVSFTGAHTALSKLCRSRCRLNDLEKKDSKRAIKSYQKHLTRVQRYTKECKYWIGKFKEKGNDKGAKHTQDLLRKVLSHRF